MSSNIFREYNSAKDRGVYFKLSGACPADEKLNTPYPRVTVASILREAGITCGVPEFCRVVGIGNKTLNKAFNNGEMDKVNGFIKRYQPGVKG